MRHAIFGTAMVLSVMVSGSAWGQAAPAAPASEARDWRYVLTIHEIARADDDVRLAQLLADNPDRLLQRLPGNGSTAAHSAAEAGALKSLQVLAKARADLNALDSRGRTPLSIATGTNYLSTAKTLLSLGADPNKEGTDIADALGQFTLTGAAELPLSIAARRGYMEMAKAFLEAKADVNKKGTNESTPLLTAAAAGNWEIATLLIDNRANVNTADRAGMTPLLYAAAASDDKQVSYLIGKGADARAKNRTGQNGLSLTQSPAIWRALVEKGADVNLVVGGVTPLQYFIEQGNLGLLRVWLEFNPDPFITNRQGHTAKELARGAAERGYSPARQEIARLTEAYQNKYAADQLAREQAAPRAAGTAQP